MAISWRYRDPDGEVIELTRKERALSCRDPLKLRIQLAREYQCAPDDIVCEESHTYCRRRVPRPADACEDCWKRHDRAVPGHLYHDGYWYRLPGPGGRWCFEPERWFRDVNDPKRWSSHRTLCDPCARAYLRARPDHELWRIEDVSEAVWGR
ncbi:MAG TPA: hypothetical protein VFS33_08150 [Gemmatimonadales bacterium]|nr:hypothetical protein [Gemmatimonadales bacterium]